MKILLFGLLLLALIFIATFPKREMVWLYPPRLYQEPETFTVNPGLPSGLEWPKDKESFRWFICHDKYEIEVLTKKEYNCL